MKLQSVFLSSSPRRFIGQVTSPTQAVLISWIKILLLQILFLYRLVFLHFARF